MKQLYVVWATALGVFLGMFMSSLGYFWYTWQYWIVLVLFMIFFFLVGRKLNKQS